MTPRPQLLSKVDFSALVNFAQTIIGTTPSLTTSVSFSLQLVPPTKPLRSAQYCRVVTTSYAPYDNGGPLTGTSVSSNVTFPSYISLRIRYFPLVSSFSLSQALYKTGPVSRRPAYHTYLTWQCAPLESRHPRASSGFHFANKPTTHRICPS